MNDKLRDVENRIHRLQKELEHLEDQYYKAVPDIDDEDLYDIECPMGEYDDDDFGADEDDGGGADGEGADSCE